MTGKSRSFNLFGSEETSHNDWNPFKMAGEMFHSQRSAKSPESDGSGGTNFVNLKKKLFLRTVFKNCF